MPGTRARGAVIILPLLERRRAHPPDARHINGELRHPVGGQLLGTKSLHGLHRRRFSRFDGDLGHRRLPDGRVECLVNAVIFPGTSRRQRQFGERTRVGRLNDGIHQFKQDVLARAEQRVNLLTELAQWAKIGVNLGHLYEHTNRLPSGAAVMQVQPPLFSVQRSLFFFV